MAGVRQKDPNQLANRRGGRGRGLVVAVPANRTTPTMPSVPDGMDWSPRVRAVWTSFWKSPVSAAVDLNADSERLNRWMEAIQEREDLLAEIRRDGYSGNWGPMGALVSHPSLVYVKHLDREIARLSEHFGATPLSRFRLQITFSEAGQKEEQLRRMKQPRGAKTAEVIDLNALG